MPRQGLGKDAIRQAAALLIEEQGLDAFSMGALARYLNVKPASLYNHVDGLESLRAEVGREAMTRLAAAENHAIEGKQGEEALFSLAEAYRVFAREHGQLYRVILEMARQDGPQLPREADAMMEPLLRVLSDYHLSDVQQYHWQRVLRGVMVGFAVHERAGGFSRMPVDENESYRIAIRCIADGLQRAGGETV